jgi:peptidoglycan hydrolase-like protein with peptidoglycan-binding domain
VPNETNKEQIAALATCGEQIKTNSAEFLWVCRGITATAAGQGPRQSPAATAPTQSHRAHNEATPMTTRQAHIYRLDIGHGTSDTPPPRQTNAQQSDIVAAQNRLIELRFLKGPADGVWGTKSRNALRAFKVANDLTADDKWDDLVSARLYSTKAARSPLPLATTSPAQ